MHSNVLSVEQVGGQRPVETYIRVCRQHAEADWAHAPSTFKLYRNCPRVPLSRETLTALSQDQDKQPAFSLGRFLHEVYGTSRICYARERGQVGSEDKRANRACPVHIQPLRTVPSGGALFPCELYVLVSSGQTLSAGVYHYDPAHHTLDVLRTGDHTPILLNALARSPEKQPGYTLVFSSLFWKDAFKYQEFSYRLQGLDIGCLLAQTQMVAGRYDLRFELHLRFLDEQLNQLLGLRHLEESVYAVITLDNEQIETGTTYVIEPDPEARPTEESPRTREQYRSLDQWPLLAAIHRASCIETRADLSKGQTVPPLTFPRREQGPAIPLPEVAQTCSGDHALHRRSAPRSLFRPRPLTLRQLALLLQTSQQSYQGDTSSQAAEPAHALLYCVINHVEEVPAGIYCYQPEQHQLQQIRAGAFYQIFSALPASQLDGENISLCLVPVGNYALGLQIYGDRWYRMQNMETGMIVQRLYLAAAASELGCRANLSYSEQYLDMLLALPSGYTSLIQVLVSPLAKGVQEIEKYDRVITW